MPAPTSVGVPVGGTVLVLGVLSVLLCLVSLAVGSHSLTLEEVAGAFVPGRTTVASVIVWQLRMPRTVLAVMVGAVMELTHAAVPGMVARGHGAVLNVASVTALTAMGTYAAHKAWVRTFTEGLASELRGTGVTATVLNPGLTHTEFHARAAMDESAWPAFVWLQADDVARQALDAVRRGQVICTPSLRYQIANAALRASPRWLVRRVAGRASLGAQATPVGEPSDALAAG